MSGLRVAVTRALPEAEASAARLRALGAEPVVAPLLRIEPRPFDGDAGDAQALLFTSSNGVHAAAKLAVCRLPALTVGDATAEAARRAGFTDVRSAKGNVAALAALVRATLRPQNGPLLYLSGADVAGDLAGALKPDGFSVRRAVVYSAEIVETLPAAYAQALDAIAFFSARAAHAYASFGAPNAARLTAACMSPGVAAAAHETATWGRVIVAPAPQEEALWAALLSS